MAYLTGRSKTITIAGTVGALAADQTDGPPPSPTPRQEGEYIVSVSGPGFSWTSRKIENEPFGYGGTATLTLLGNMSGTGEILNFTSPAWYNWNGVLTGNYSVSFPVSEWADYIDDGAPTPAHFPRKLRLSLSERMTVGGTITAAFNALMTHSDGRTSDLSLSDSRSIGTANVVTHGATFAGSVQAINRNVYAFAAGTWNGYGLGVGYSVTGTASSLDANAGAYVNSTSAGPATGQETSAQISTFAALPRAFELLGVTRRQEELYPGSLQMSIIDRAGSGGTLINASGTFAHSYSQQWFSVSGALDGTAVPGTALNEWGDISIKAGTASLSSLGEDTSDTRCQFRGHYWDAATLSQASSGVLYAGTASGSPSVTISLPDGSTDAGFQGTDWSGVSLCGYRYLRFTGAGTALTIGSKVWTQDSSGNVLNPSGTTTFTIDLRIPTSGTVETDSTDTRFPLVSGPPWSVNDGVWWGVSNATAITLESSGTARIGNVRLIRSDSSLVTILPTHENWISDGVGSEYPISWGEGRTDRRLSLEMVPGYRTGGTLTQRSIDALAQSVNGSAVGYPSDKWSMTVAVAGTAGAGTADPLSPYFLNGSLPANFLYGNGMLIQSGTAWQYAFDLDASSSLTLPGQVLFDSLSWYPQSGDSFSFGTVPSGSAIPLRAAYMIRAGGVGLLVGTDHLPVSGGTVTVDDLTSGGGAGTALSDALGFYKTGSPYGKGNHSHRVTYRTSTHTRTWQNRKRWNVSFYGGSTPGNATGLSYDVSDAGRHCIGYVDGGSITLGFNTDAFGLSYSSRPTGIAGSAPCVRWDNGTANRLYLHYDDGSGLKNRYTIDEGNSLSVATTVTATGSRVRSVFARDGRRYFYWYDGGAIYSRVYDSTDTALGTAYPVVSSGVDDDDIDADEWYGNLGQWRVNLHYRSGGSLISKSSTDGVTFS